MEEFTPLYDLSTIRMISDNDATLFTKILTLLVSSLATERDNIILMAKEDKWKQVSETVHKIKTSLIHIQVNSLIPIIKELEYYEDHSIEELNVYVQELCTVLTDVVTHLKVDLAAISTN